jgi:hypothetical protein
MPGFRPMSVAAFAITRDIPTKNSAIPYSSLVAETRERCRLHIYLSRNWLVPVSSLKVGKNYLTLPPCSAPQGKQKRR